MDKKSKYWRLKLMETVAPKDWKEKLGKLPVIVSPRHMHDVTDEFLQTTHPIHYRLHKADKLPAFWYLFYIGKTRISEHDVRVLFKAVPIAGVKYIDDSDSNDMPLKEQLRQSVLSNRKNYDYSISKFETLGGLVWDNDDWTAKGHKGYKWYVVPFYYSRSQLIHYRYWTQKCLDYLPDHADSERKSMYGSGTYETYSEDTVLRVEQDPRVAKIIARKKKRNSDPEEIKKAKETVRKRKATIKQKEEEKKVKQEKIDAEKAKAIISQFDDDIAKIRETDKYADLTILMKYLSIINHLAKTFESDDRIITAYNGGKFCQQEIEEYDKLAKLYKGEGYLYDLKDKVFNKLYHDAKYKDVVNLSAFIPDEPDKVWVTFCDFHNELRREFYEPPLDFYYENEREINNCKQCNVSREHYYYAFYYFTVKTSETTTWHVPYPVGKSYLPNIDKLKQETQEFNEGGAFLFGSEASEDEILFALHRDVTKPILDYLEK